jgi:hypothetical protein
MTENTEAGFLQRAPIRRFLRRAAANWRERHQHPFNRGIHAVGIPLSLLVAPALLVAFPWWWALAAFVAGYLLQWIGHLVEGNDVGEWAGVKQMLGLPYVAIAPRYAKPADEPR